MTGVPFCGYTYDTSSPFSSIANIRAETPTGRTPMNWIGFVRLMRSIYGRELPDLQKIQDQGLLAVKIAQVFALRIDFLNREKCQHLARLYRHTVEIPAEDMRRLLRQYTDDDFAGRFNTITDNALASASVGQVHRARLKGGDEVIIKLIKADCKKQFVRDVRSIKRLFQLAIMFYPKLQKVADPVGILENIEDYTLTELNLLNEIKGQDILKNIYLENRDRFDLSHLKFAELYRDLSNENVLVAEFIEGKTFDELLEEGRMPYDQLLELFHIHGFYMFVNGTFHGDIHPGNIILNDGNIYFVDTSAISRTGPKIRRGLFDFFTAPGLLGLRRMCRLPEQHGRNRHHRQTAMKLSRKNLLRSMLTSRKARYQRSA